MTNKFDISALVQDLEPAKPMRPQVPLLLSLLMEQGHVELFSTLPLNTLLSALYSAVASTIIAYGLWFYLMRCYDVSLVTPFSLLSPIFGIACGQIFFAEALSLQTVLGGVVTILGVTILVWRRPKLKIVGGE